MNGILIVVTLESAYGKKKKKVLMMTDVKHQLPGKDNWTVVERGMRGELGQCMYK